MKRFRCMTNNPMARDEAALAAEYMEADILALYDAVERELEKGHALLSHPLTSSIRPDQSPYKTVLLSAAPGARDEEGLRLLRRARAYASDLLSMHAPYQWSEEALRDFQFVDLDIIRVAIERGV